MRPSAAFDVNSEITKLRDQFNTLNKKKHDEEIRRRTKAMNASISSTQMRLYKEGVTKQMSLREKELNESRDAQDNTFDPVPIPVCDRLYEEGKKKKMTQQWEEHQLEEAAKLKLEEEEKLKRLRLKTPSQICDRLYDDAMTKQIKQQLEEQKLEEAQKLKELKLKNPSSIPICDRLYREGMQKQKSQLE